MRVWKLSIVIVHNDKVFIGRILALRSKGAEGASVIINISVIKFIQSAISMVSFSEKYIHSTTHTAFNPFVRHVLNTTFTVFAVLACFHTTMMNYFMVSFYIVYMMLGSASQGR